MPRSSVILSPEPIGHAAVAAAAADVRERAFGDASDAAAVALRTMDSDAVLQVVVDGLVVLSLLRPRPLPRLDEVARLLPGVEAPASTNWWADAYTPWRPEGAIGVAILDAAAAASGALVVHQGLAPTRDPQGGNGGGALGLA